MALRELTERGKEIMLKVKNKKEYNYVFTFCITYPYF
ncbi:hypothetical protein YN1HA_18310 [Sulfurisphaera ohwakuensis]